MTIKSMDSAAPRNLQNFNRQPEQTGKLASSVSSDGQNKLEPYAGGTLQVDVYKEDTQRDFVWRGLYKHAEAAGLSHEEAVKFAGVWSSDNLMHQANGKTRAYTAREFAALKQKGVTGFDLNEQYSPQVLSDLRQRQAAYQISQNERNAAPLDAPSMSTPQYNDAERAVNWLTGAITSVTGEDSEVGKQFNRLSVSSLRLLGQVGELQNKATETINDAIRSVAPESVDNLLNKVDQTNRENAQALKNANSTVTNNDRMEDVWAAKNGINRPLAEDLHRNLMHFPEAIPNAIDSAIKGDFKADDGSYSDKVGKIIGGLNPLGDIRDIVANGKKVIQGDGKATIPLIASVVGGVPGFGDVAKPIIKKVGGELTEKAVKEVGGETIERTVKEEVPQIVKKEESFIGTLRGEKVILPDVPTQSVQYTKRATADLKELRKDFNKVRAVFLKDLSNNTQKLETLKKAGFTATDITKLQKGEVPDGWQVHHKLPLDDGGTNAFENLVLIKNEPYHKTITNAQRTLVGDLKEGQTRIVDFPIPKGNIYPFKP